MAVHARRGPVPRSHAADRSRRHALQAPSRGAPASTDETRPACSIAFRCRHPRKAGDPVFELTPVQTEKPRHSRRRLLSDPPTAKTSVAWHHQPERISAKPRSPLKRSIPEFPTKVGGHHMSESTDPARDSSLKDR